MDITLEAVNTMPPGPELDLIGLKLFGWRLEWVDEPPPGAYEDRRIEEWLAIYNKPDDVPRFIFVRYKPGFGFPVRSREDVEKSLFYHDVPRPSRNIADAFQLHRDGWSWRFSETVLRVIASVHNTHIEVYEDTGHISEACVYWSEIGGTHGDPAAYALARTRCAIKVVIGERDA